MRTVALWALGTLLLGACSVLGGDADGQPDQSSVQPLQRVVGQTFVAQRAGLDSIEVYLAPTQPDSQENDGSSSTVTLNLYDDVDSPEPIRSASVGVTASESVGYHAFEFRPQAPSKGTYYYFTLTMDPAGSLAVGTDPSARYLHGTQYIDGLPVDSQLTFRLGYRPSASIYGWFQLAGQALRTLLYSLVLLFLPGLALLALSGVILGTKYYGDWAVWLALAGSVGLALRPVGYLWADVFGMQIVPAGPWLLAALSVLVILLVRRPTLRGLLDSLSWGTVDWTLLLVISLIYLLRMAAIDTLRAPLWGDSVQHAVMTQLILDNQGLFNSWLPYTPYETLSIHYGFSANASAWMQISGQTIEQSLLQFGQIVNTLAVLSLYPLAVRVTDGNRWAGVAALMIAGVLSPLPAMYLNWGRYAQLTGQAILPAAIILTWAGAEVSRQRWRVVLLASLTIAGMFLSYYRMPFYFVSFFLAWLICWALPTFRTNWRQWIKGGGTLLATALAAGLLVLPWLIRINDSHLAQVASGTLQSQNSALTNVINHYRDWMMLPDQLPLYLMILALAGLVVSLVMRRWSVAMVGVWTLILAALRLGEFISIPGIHFIQPFAVIIALYIPIAVLVGWLFGYALDRLQTRPFRYVEGVAFVAVIACGILFGPSQASVVDNTYMMVTEPDRQAMSWLRENTAEDATILVEGFTIWEDTSAVGSDAGWWTPVLADRGNTMPPQYALLNERPIQPDYSEQVVRLVSSIAAESLHAESVLHQLCDENVSHIYIGQTEGKTGINSPQLFSAQDVESNPHFGMIYQKDRVRIFEFKRDVCNQ